MSVAEVDRSYRRATLLTFKMLCHMSAVEVDQSIYRRATLLTFKILCHMSAAEVDQRLPAAARFRRGFR